MSSTTNQEALARAKEFARNAVRQCDANIGEQEKPYVEYVVQELIMIQDPPAKLDIQISAQGKYIHVIAIGYQYQIDDMKWMHTFMARDRDDRMQLVVGTKTNLHLKEPSKVVILERFDHATNSTTTRSSSSSKASANSHRKRM